MSNVLSKPKLVQITRTDTITSSKQQGSHIPREIRFIACVQYITRMSSLFLFFEDVMLTLISLAFLAVFLDRFPKTGFCRLETQGRLGLGLSCVSSLQKTVFGNIVKFSFPQNLRLIRRSCTKIWIYLTETVI